MPSYQSRITEKAKFTCYYLRQAFEKQVKTIEDQEMKQVEALKSLKPEEKKEEIKSIEEIFPEDTGTNEIKNEIYEIKKWEDKIKREDLKYKTKNYTYDFQRYGTKIFW